MSRADRAKAVIENEEFQGAFKKIEKDILTDMKRLDPSDKEGAQALIVAHQVLDRITKHFKLLLDNNDEKIAEFKARRRNAGNG